MKNKLMKALTFPLVLCTAATAIPMSTYAASQPANNNVIYYKNASGQPIGIKEIKLDGNTYYDCSDNKSQVVNSSYYHNLLSKDVTLENGETINILDQWASIAAAIFENGGEYTCCPDDNGDDYDNLYGKNYTNKSNENCYVGEVLANPESQSGGEKGNDYYHSTGLSTANSLSEVRTKMGDEIADGVDRTNCTGSYILSQGDFDDALPELDNDKSQPVIYNMVTSVARDGKTPKYRYNSYGLAFYDFNLSIITDEGLEYATNGESYGNVCEVNPDSFTAKYYHSTTNNSLVDAEMNVELRNETIQSVSTSIENSNSISLTESAEASAKFVGTGVKTSFTCSEVFNTSSCENNTFQKGNEPDSGVKVVVPAHTQVVVKQDFGESSTSVYYSVPVEVSFNVAVFSMSGDVYADGKSTSSMSTNHYTQRYFYTTFGENDKNAYESLNKRISNTNMTGEDHINGNTHVFYGEHMVLSSKTTKDDRKDYDINWNNVETTYNCNTGSTTTIKDFSTNVPMISNGAHSEFKAETYISEIYDYEPLYLPKYIKMTNPNLKPDNIVKGKSYCLSKLNLIACDKDGVSYYDYKYADGHWEVCEDSKDVLEYDSKSNTITAIGEVGDVGYIQYVINDGIKYTSVYETGTATTETITPLTLQFTII